MTALVRLPARQVAGHLCGDTPKPRGVVHELVVETWMEFVLPLLIVGAMMALVVAALVVLVVGLLVVVRALAVLAHMAGGG